MKRTRHVMAGLLWACCGAACTASPATPGAQSTGTLNVIAVGIALVGILGGAVLVWRRNASSAEEALPPPTKKGKQRGSARKR